MYWNLLKMRGLQCVWMIWVVLVGLSCTVSASKCAYPSDGTKCVGVADVGLKPLRREVYDNGEIFDITRKSSPHTPVGGSVEGIGQFNKLLLSMKNGSDYNFSEMRIPVHSGTHVDAPCLLLLLSKQPQLILYFLKAGNTS
ncbi:hypothetical protein ACS0TY_026645 [Phlomoides rotata]